MNDEQPMPRNQAPGVRAFEIGGILAAVTFVTGMVVLGLAFSWGAPGPNETGMNQDEALKAGLLLVATMLTLGFISAVFLLYGFVKYITKPGTALQCSRCGYSTRGLQSDVCPECGASLD